MESSTGGGEGSTSVDPPEVAAESVTRGVEERPDRAELESETGGLDLGRREPHGEQGPVGRRRCRREWQSVLLWRCRLPARPGVMTPDQKKLVTEVAHSSSGFMSKFPQNSSGSTWTKD